jgi:MFS transporter, SP family, sugar:H+ symporter
VKWGPGNANLQSKIFFIWFACCFLCIAFVYFFIYETKGLTLEQIDELYDEVSIASKSTGWVPSKTFSEQRGRAGRKEGVLVGKEGEKDGGLSGDAGVVEHKE